MTLKAELFGPTAHCWPAVLLRFWLPWAIQRSTVCFHSLFPLWKSHSLNLIPKAASEWSLGKAVRTKLLAPSPAQPRQTWGAPNESIGGHKQRAASGQQLVRDSVEGQVKQHHWNLFRMERSAPCTGKGICLFKAENGPDVMYGARQTSLYTMYAFSGGAVIMILVTESHCCLYEWWPLHLCSAQPVWLYMAALKRWASFQPGSSDFSVLYSRGPHKSWLQK